MKHVLDALDDRIGELERTNKVLVEQCDRGLAEGRKRDERLAKLERDERVSAMGKIELLLAAKEVVAQLMRVDASPKNRTTRTQALDAVVAARVRLTQALDVVRRGDEPGRFAGRFAEGVDTEEAPSDVARRRHHRT